MGKLNITSNSNSINSSIRSELSVIELYSSIAGAGGLYVTNFK